MTKQSPLTTVAVHPLAFAVSVWGLLIGALTLAGESPSGAIDSLPYVQGAAWAILAVLASATTLWGLFISRRMIAVARGLYVHGCVVTVYGLAIIYQIGWGKGGAAASFAILISAVFGAEARNLQRQYAALTKRSKWG